MTGSGRGLQATGLEAKLDDLRGVNALQVACGDRAWPLLRKQYLALGYSEGVARLTRLAAAGDLDSTSLAADPVEWARAWLQGFFDDRRGAMPEIWAEDGTVFLRTKECRRCLTLEAETQEPVPHGEICYAYCRAWAEGYMDVLTDLVPGLVVHYHNADSRRTGPGHDCVEAFQVVTP
ncbi:MAG: hypothetical protein GY838_02055 [bacterium]|nr:hypothetical protein [bacterium]